MNMRTPITLLAFLIVVLAFAQNDDIKRLPPERLKELKAQKVAFITQRLAFTPEEAQGFWPIYNAYEQELEDVRRAIGQNRREARDLAEVTDTQAREMLAKEMELDRQEMEIRHKFIKRFEEAIGARKALFVGRAEREFTRQVIRQVRNDRGPRRDGPMQDRPGGR